MQHQRGSNDLAGIVVTEFDNSGLGPLLVPGLSNLPLYVDTEPGKRRFAPALDDSWHWPARATAREIAMLRCMERITDRPDWHEDVFSEEKIAQWKEEDETKADWRISDKAWAWCVLELRDKARRFIEMSRTVILDYTSGAVCKVDLSSHELPGLLKAAVQEAVEKEPAKGCPSPDGVARIVDTHLAPLVYGQTKVLSEGGVVGLEDMDDWYGRGLPSPGLKISQDTHLGREMQKAPPTTTRGYGEGVLWANCTQSFSGYRVRWLPCEVAFTGDVESPVWITSYINDTHPHRQAPLYSAIEKAIVTAIDSWNDILIPADSTRQLLTRSETSRRTPARINTFGVQYPLSLRLLEDEFLKIKREDEDRESKKLTASDILAILSENVRLLEGEVAKGMVGSRAQQYPDPGYYWTHNDDDFWLLSQDD